MAKLKPGGRAKVTAAADERFGQVGIVDYRFDENGEHVFLLFDDDSDLYAFGFDEVTPMADKKNARYATRKMEDADPPTAPSSGHQLKPGGWALVTAPGDERLGQIGTVDHRLDEDGDHVFLLFDDDPDLYAFRFNEVTPHVPRHEHPPEDPRSTWTPKSHPRTAPDSPPSTITPDSSPASPPPPSRLAAALSTSVRSVWAGLSTAGKSAVVGTLALALVVLVGVLVDVGSRDERSLEYGFKELSPLAVTIANSGVSGDETAVCEEAFGFVEAYDAATDSDVASQFVKADVIAGCVDGIRDRDGSSQNARAQDSGDTGDRFAELLARNYGISVGSATAADIADVACSSPMQGVGLYSAQQELSQRHQEINRSNPNAVGVAMSAAVLAFCPERLP